MIFDNINELDKVKKAFKVIHSYEENGKLNSDMVKLFKVNTIRDILDNYSIEDAVKMIADYERKQGHDVDFDLSVEVPFGKVDREAINDMTRMFKGVKGSGFSVDIDKEAANDMTNMFKGTKVSEGINYKGYNNFKI